MTISKATTTPSRERAELRKFGLAIGIVLCLFGILLLWREKVWYVYLLILSLVFVSLGLALPDLLKPLHKTWMSLAERLGWFTTRVILYILFFLVVTPVGLLARLCGKDFLDLKLDRSAKSYWTKQYGIKYNKNNYENQF